VYVNRERVLCVEGTTQPRIERPVVALRSSRTPVIRRSRSVRAATKPSSREAGVQLIDLAMTACYCPVQSDGVFGGSQPTCEVWAWMQR
jgi:hypothetical protein